jgi:hypothetical protein
MRVDLSHGIVTIEGFTNNPVIITKEEAASLAFAISAAIQDDSMAFEVADMMGCTRCPHTSKKGDELWAEECTRQYDGGKGDGDL